MSASDIAFCAAVITVVPVFLVAYVVGVQKLMSNVFEHGYVRSSKNYLQYLRKALQDEDDRTVKVIRAMASMVMMTVYQVALFCVFLLAVGLPAIGEYCALHGLYVGQVSSTEKTLALLGALTAGAIVIAPLAYIAFRAYDPWAGIRAPIRLLISQLSGGRPGNATRDPD